MRSSARTVIVPMSDGHASAVLEIYRLGIATGNATFESEPPSWSRFTATRLAEHRWVALDPADPATVLGWIACSRVSDRPVYAGIVEHSVYVRPDAQGRGLGRLLLQRLIASTEQSGIWTIQSAVFPENLASIMLHRACGFRVIGTRERIGCHHGVWRDVVLIERRSPIVV